MDLKPAFTPAPNVKIAGVYMVVDKTAGQYYIGATEDGVSRFVNHNADLRANRHHNKGLQEAYNANHELDPIFVQAPEGFDPFHLERALISEFMDSGLLYNQAQGMGGRKHSAESIEKMRQAKLGKVASDETRLKMSASAKGKNLGIKRSPETIALYKERRLEQARAVVVEGVEYESVSAAARAYGISPSTASSRCRSTTENHTNWFFKG